MKKRFPVLILILLLAGFFRLYQLSHVPPSSSLDEASIGWNAYSILKTGKDEYGYRFPLLLRAYDDWRPALYVYFVVPFVKFLGLSVLSVRLPSAFLSLVTVAITYFLVKELFKEEKLAFWAAFLLAISPWHIYLSRLGHEVNLGLTLSLSAILFFLKSLERRKRGFLFLSALFFALSFYSYQSQKIFIPFILLALALIFRKQLLTRKKDLFLAGLLGLLLVVPILKASLSPDALVRFQATSLFNNQPEVQQLSSLRIARDYEGRHFLGLIFDNRRVAMGLAALRAYFSHFNPSWLFFNSGREDHKVPGMGLLYLWELPLLLLGADQLMKGKFPLKNKILIFSWLLIAPLPAGMTTGAPHVMRSFNVLPLPQILAALGIASLLSSLTLKSFKKWFWLLAIALFFISLTYFYHNYFVNFPSEQSDSFQYSLTQAIDYVLEVEDQYSKVVFSNQDNCFQSYMFYLFLSQYEPVLYLAQGGTISGGFAENHAFAKYEFRPINWEKEKSNERALFVGNPTDFPSSVESVYLGKYLDEEMGIKVVEGQK